MPAGVANGKGSKVNWHTDDELQSAEATPPGHKQARVENGTPTAGLKVAQTQYGASTSSGACPSGAEPLPQFGGTPAAACEGEPPLNAPTPEERIVGELDAAVALCQPQAEVSVHSLWYWRSDDEAAAEMPLDESQSTQPRPDGHWGIPIGTEPGEFANEPDAGPPAGAYSRTHAAAQLAERLLARRRVREQLGVWVDRSGREVCEHGTLGPACQPAAQPEAASSGGATPSSSPAAGVLAASPGRAQGTGSEANEASQLPAQGEWLWT
jgi:hypothetical protein